VKVDEDEKSTEEQPAEKTEPKTEQEDTKSEEEDPKEETEPGDPKQDEPESKEPAKVDDEKTDDEKTLDEKTDPKSADPEKAEPKTDPETTQPVDDAKLAPKGKASEQFAIKFSEWKRVLAALRLTQEKYQLAETEAEAEALSKDWHEHLAKGRTLLEELSETSVQAYTEAPNTDRNITRFVLNVLQDQLRHDDYEKAFSLATLLAAKGAGSGDVHNAAGIAAYMTNNYDEAEKMLDEALRADSTSPLAEKLFESLDKRRIWWEEEKKIRAAEAKADDLPRVKMTTSKGDIVFELYENEAPDTVGNFISLVEKDFYNGLTFHRVLPGAVMQGGDPRGDGTGGPGYNIFCECEKAGARRHFRGVLSMAHAGPDTGGSQFFVTFTPRSDYDFKHTAFGRVIEGMDVLAKIQRRDPSQTDVKLPTPDTIIKAEVIRKREHEYAPNKVKE